MTGDPAEMPSEAEIAKLISGAPFPSTKSLSKARAVLALFAPILAEKERLVSYWLYQHDQGQEEIRQLSDDLTFAEHESKALEARALAAEAALSDALDALKPFSALADSYFYRYETRPGVFRESHEDDPDERAVYGINRVEITTGHLRRARAALAQIAAPGAAMEAP